MDESKNDNHFIRLLNIECLRIITFSFTISLCLLSSQDLTATFIRIIMLSFLPLRIYYNVVHIFCFPEIFESTYSYLVSWKF